MDDESEIDERNRLVASYEGQARAFRDAAARASARGDRVAARKSTSAAIAEEINKWTYLMGDDT